MGVRIQTPQKVLVDGSCRAVERIGGAPGGLRQKLRADTEPRFSLDGMNTGVSGDGDSEWGTQPSPRPKPGH